MVPPEGDGLIPARIIRFSPMNELALLEFSGGLDLPALTISTVEPHAGDGVVALGYPMWTTRARPAPICCARRRRRARRARSHRCVTRAPTGEPIPHQPPGSHLLRLFGRAAAG